MSIMVSIGSNPQDYENLIAARDLAKFVSSLMKAEDHTLIFADKNYSQKDINNVISWIDDILNILYNGGNLEDLSDLEPLGA